MQPAHTSSARTSKILSLFLACALLLPLSVPAGEIVVPAETVIYAEITQGVTSRKWETAVGDVIPARVRSDVVIDGEVVIEEGAELLLRVSEVRKARFFGRKGKLELEAASVQAVDGSRIPLHGAQYRTGKGRKAVTAALTVAVAWPFLFVRGRNARAPEGTVFEAYVSGNQPVDLPARVAAR